MLNPNEILLNPNRILLQAIGVESQAIQKSYRNIWLWLKQNKFIKSRSELKNLDFINLKADPDEYEATPQAIVDWQQKNFFLAIMPTIPEATIQDESDGYFYYKVIDYQPEKPYCKIYMELYEKTKDDIWVRACCGNLEICEKQNRKPDDPMYDILLEPDIDNSFIWQCPKQQKEDVITAKSMMSERYRKQESDLFQMSSPILLSLITILNYIIHTKDLTEALQPERDTKNRHIYVFRPYVAKTKAPLTLHPELIQKKTNIKPTTQTSPISNLQTYLNGNCIYRRKRKQDKL